MTQPLRIFALLLATTSIAFAQKPTPAAPSSATSIGYAIRGIVVSAATGKSLDRATVTLSLSTNQNSKIAEALTRDDGAFGFEHVPAGQYALHATRRGYNAAGYDEHEGYFTAIVTGPNLDTTSLRFVLQPQSIISGTVTDDAGDPVRDAQVLLYRKNSFEGLGRITQHGGAQTNDIGQFEFAPLTPGDYFVSVQATPWYATRPQQQLSVNGTAPPDPPTLSPLDVAYPLTFYADATDSDSATPIPVRAGDHLQVNISLRAVPAVHLRMPVSPESPRRGITWPQLTQNVFGQKLPVGIGDYYNQASGAEITGIPPGHYQVRYPGQNGERDLDLTSNATLDKPPSDPGEDILGKVVMRNGQPLPPGMNVILNASTANFNLGGSVDKDGTFKLQGVSAGTYDVEIGGPYSITRIAADGASTEGHQLKVATTPVNLVLIVTPDSATVRGYAKHNGQSVSGAMIVLVPRDPDADRELFRRDQTNSDGSFELRNVAPGAYTLITIDDGWSLDWARPEVLARYLPHGVKINITASQRNIAVPESVDVEPR